jgi:glutathione S-transferase
MTEITLYHFPGGCSSITLCALEEIGVAYDLVLVDITKGEQRRPDYLAMNRWGKVPTLKVNSHVLTENAAILYHLHRCYPEVRLLPSETLVMGENQPLADLLWCAATLHPMTRQVRMPVRFTSGDPDCVKAHGIAAWQPVLEYLSERLENGRWWYGNDWSIIDLYLYWNYSTAQGEGLDLAPFTAVQRHAEMVSARESYVRARSRERAALSPTVTSP